MFTYIHLEDAVMLIRVLIEMGNEREEWIKDVKIPFFAHWYRKELRVFLGGMKYDGRIIK